MCKKSQKYVFIKMFDAKLLLLSAIAVYRFSFVLGFYYVFFFSDKIQRISMH